MIIPVKLKSLFAPANSNFAQLHELVKDTRRRRVLASDAEAFVYLFLERILHLGDDAIRELKDRGIVA